MSGLVPALAAMVVIGLAMTAVYGGALALLRSPDIAAVAGPFAARLKRR
ncbi:hypothetical protein [Naasia aerilata]|nr:hypothetical protein [Naasia aerilata]